MDDYGGYIPLTFLIVGAILFLISLIYSRAKTLSTRLKGLRCMSFALSSFAMTGITYLYLLSVEDYTDKYSLRTVALATIGLIILSGLFYKAYEMRTNKGP